MFALNSNAYDKIVKTGACVKTLNKMLNIVGSIIEYLTIFRFLILKINAKATNPTKYKISNGFAVFNIIKFTIKYASKVKKANKKEIYMLANLFFFSMT